MSTMIRLPALSVVVISILVVGLMTKGKFRSYWSETGSYEVVVLLSCMNFDGLKTTQQESRKLLMATLAKDEKRVAREIEKVHNEYISLPYAPYCKQVCKLGSRPGKDRMEANYGRFKVYCGLLYLQ